MSAGKSDDFRKILERVSHRHDLRRSFDAFTRLSACALAAQTREADYLEAVSYTHLDVYKRQV